MFELFAATHSQIELQQIFQSLIQATAGINQPSHLALVHDGMTAPSTKGAAMETLFLNEAKLANRWCMSTKTLQRWRMDGRGPSYLKLSKWVVYPIEGIMDFEDRSAYLPNSCRRGITALSERFCV
jgi:hypothetical protein